MNHHKILILGAGISSLSCAHFLEENNIKDYLILERENEVGGMIRDIVDDGRVFSTSGHYCHFKDKEVQGFFANRVPLISKQRVAKIMLNNELIDFPFQLNFMQIKDKKLKDKILNDYLNKDEQMLYTNLKEKLKSEYGEEMCNQFLFPYNEKLYGDLNNLDVNAMGRFFPDNNLKQFIENLAEKNNNAGYNSEIMMPASGKFGDIMNALKYDRSKVYLNTIITEIHENEKTVIDSEGNIYHYDYLISTLPMNVFLNLIDYDNEDSKHFKARTIRVFNVEINKQDSLWGCNWIYFPEKKYSFFRVGDYDNFFDLNKKTHRLYIETPEGTTYVQVQKDLMDAKIIDNYEQILYIKCVDLIGGYNIITPKTIDLVNKYKKMFDDISLVGRYARWTYLSVEDCFVESKQCIEELVELMHEEKEYFDMKKSAKRI